MGYFHCKLHQQSDKNTINSKCCILVNVWSVVVVFYKMYQKIYINYPFNSLLR